MPAFDTGRFVTAGERVLLAELPAAHHMVGALRIRPGERLVLFHEGELYDAAVEELPGAGLAAVIQSVRPSPLASRPLVLVQAVIRPALLDDVVRLVTPLGVRSVVLFAGERSQPWNVAGRLGRLTEVARSAAEQSETGIVPEISLEDSLGAALKCLEPARACIALSPRADRTLLQLSGPAWIRAQEAAALVVGPEGGFSEEEERLMDSRGVRRARLNTGVLRSELAGFAALLVIREMQELP
jgi:16S rRNA (uracil1498-N3)-methyltransferase